MMNKPPQEPHANLNQATSGKRSKTSMKLSSASALTETSKQTEHAGRTKEKKKDGGAPGGSKDKVHPTTDVETLPSKQSKARNRIAMTSSAGGPALPKSPEAMTERVGKTKERKKGESGRGSEDVPESKQNKSKSIATNNGTPFQHDIGKPSGPGKAFIIGGGGDDGLAQNMKRNSTVSPGIRDSQASKDVEYSTDATVEEAPSASISSITIDIEKQKRGRDQMTEEEEIFWLKRFFACVGIALLVIAVIIAFGILMGQLTAGRN